MTLARTFRLHHLIPGGTLLALGLLLTLARAQSPAPDAAVDPDAPVTIASDDTWRPFDYNLDINAGSVFDFSALNDAPAGKYGPVIVTPSGHFEFKNRPGVRVKFWGVNICTQALYLDKDKDDAIALRLRRETPNVDADVHIVNDGTPEAGAEALLNALGNLAIGSGVSNIPDSA